jgi:hypothetical protein
MRKLLIGVAGAVGLLLATMLAWNAEATPLTSATFHETTNYSLVEKTGCKRSGICPKGQHMRKGECISCTLPPCPRCPCYVRCGWGWCRVC